MLQPSRPILRPLSRARPPMLVSSGTIWERVSQRNVRFGDRHVSHTRSWGSCERGIRTERKASFWISCSRRLLGVGVLAPNGQNGIGSGKLAKRLQSVVRPALSSRKLPFAKPADPHRRIGSPLNAS
ncbi:hypothetical protein NIBR502774_16070 (plasmid) [Rhizobium sp. NIBRBAC000502774]|uniref:Uncharacterized protein n=2 Tax=Agrobacterium tumefaciens complex TaxID=1183400 RepID=Q7D3T7_AGRFC|nr:AttP [Agrobacterium fabrum str. C58]AAK90515.1 conserved hypothetical protein [Agrobacterium fabrum str. C58]QDG94065.1 hypothetical protein NIBR502774_16070 [Rhizobium sp. NIBRBAC000502774]QRM62667.1 hypothetical protein F3P66_25125 [Agrobacterium fabrum]TRB28122.1 hypothetical protein EXN51_15815 [Agrobacterium fabrum]